MKGGVDGKKRSDRSTLLGAAKGNLEGGNLSRRHRGLKVGHLGSSYHLIIVHQVKVQIDWGLNVSSFEPSSEVYLLLLAVYSTISYMRQAFSHTHYRKRFEQEKPP